MKIDHDSSLPLHSQVEVLIRGMLKETKYQEGELLPPEARIAERLGVCRNTVRSAITRLVHEGVLERKAGQGTRYIRQSVKTSLENWPSFSREMQAKGIEAEVYSTVVKEVKPSPKVSRLLRLSTKARQQKVVMLERVRGYGGNPAVHSVSWFHPCAGLSADDDFSIPLYNLISDRSGIVPESSAEEISAALADERLAGLLGCSDGDPILVRNRVVSDSSRRVVEYNENHYRADRFTYGLTLYRDGGRI